MNDADDRGISIRRGTSNDHILLAEIGAETFYDTFASVNTSQDMQAYLENAFHPRIQAAELAEPSSSFFIAEVNGESVGYARVLEGRHVLEIPGTHPIEIVRLYARTRWIGKGIGAALMQACLDEARTRSCDVVWLDVWEENHRAIRFYRKWGFEQVGTQKFRLGSDIQKDWLMTRSVT